MAIETDDLVLVGIVTVLSCYQLATFAQKIGQLRRKHKVEPPEIDGPPEFQRGFRAQQNCIEFFPIYMGCLWTSGLFFHQVPAALAGLGYIYARDLYFSAYVREAEARVPPFKLSINFLKAFVGMSSLGLTQAFLYNYLGINLKGMVGLG